MKGKVCVVSGGTSGIGQATAQALVDRGAHVLLPCRDLERGSRALRPGAGSAEALACDFMSQASIRAFAAEVRRRHRCVDVLVHSAGGLFPRRVLTEDGLEAHFGVNYLGAFLLTRELLDPLRASGRETGSPARVVSVTGDLHRRARLDLGDLQLRRGFSLPRAGMRAILAKVTFTLELGRRLEGQGVVANALHPGGVRTNLLRNLPGALRAIASVVRPFQRTPEEGAKTAVYLACSPEVEGVTARYFADERAVDPAPWAADPAIAGRLWAASEVLARTGAWPVAG